LRQQEVLSLVIIMMYNSLRIIHLLRYSYPTHWNVFDDSSTAEPGNRISCHWRLQFIFELLYEVSKQVHCYLKQTATRDIIKELLNSKNSYSSQGSWLVRIFTESADCRTFRSKYLLYFLVKTT